MLKMPCKVAEIQVNGFHLPANFLSVVDGYVMEWAISYSNYEVVFYLWKGTKGKVGEFYADEILKYYVSKVYGYGEIRDSWFQEYKKYTKNLMGVL